MNKIKIKKHEQDQEIEILAIDDKNRLPLSILEAAFPGADGLFYIKDGQTSALSRKQNGDGINKPFFEVGNDLSSQDVFFTTNTPPGATSIQEMHQERFIRVINGEQDEAFFWLPLEEGNRLTLSTLQSVFPQANGLFYRHNNGICAVRRDPEGKFLEKPTGGWWSGHVFFTKFAPSSATPSIKDVAVERNREQNLDPANQEGDVSEVSPEAEQSVQKMMQYVYQIDGKVACATAIGPHHLATGYHCIQHAIPTGADVDEEPAHRDAKFDLVNLKTKDRLEAKILIYSIEKDVVILVPLHGAHLMQERDVFLGTAWVGQPYYALGTPISDDGAPLQVISGRISSKLKRTLMTRQLYILHGHGSARLGSSGGPVIAHDLSFGKPALLGIVQAGQNIGPDTSLGVLVSTNYVKIIATPSLETICARAATSCVFKF